MMYNFSFKFFFAYPLVVLSIIIYIYFLKINFPPFYLILPYFLLGICVFISEVLTIGIMKKYLYYLFLVALSFLWAFFSYTYNVNSDFFYVKETLLISLIYFFSAFGIKKLFICLGLNFNFENILKFSIIAVFFQLLVSLLANFHPALMSFFISFIDVDGLSLNAVNSFMEARFVGLGASFFGSGIVTSFFLILLSYFINRHYKGENYLFYTFVYIFFVIVGLLFSRTTLLGVILSLLFFINVKSIIKGTIIITPILFLALFMFGELVNSNEKISFGLDFLFNFKNSQASDSVGTLTEMYDILPEKLDTWLFGDSKYKVLLNGNFIGYYKDTDVGYFRVIFSNGVVGLLIFIFLNIYVLFKSFSNKLLFSLLVLCFLALNFKGVAHIYIFSFLFFIINNSTPDPIDLKEENVI